MRNLQEQVKKALCYQKLFAPFTVIVPVVSKFCQTIDLSVFTKKVKNLAFDASFHELHIQFAGLG